MLVGLDVLYKQAISYCTANLSTIFNYTEYRFQIHLNTCIRQQIKYKYIHIYIIHVILSRGLMQNITAIISIFYA